MSGNHGDAPPTQWPLSRSQSRSETPNPVPETTGSQQRRGERLTARSEDFGVGPVEDRPRGIGTTWTLDAPNPNVNPARWPTTDPIPYEAGGL